MLRSVLTVFFHVSAALCVRVLYLTYVSSTGERCYSILVDVSHVYSKGFFNEKFHQGNFSITMAVTQIVGANATYI